MTAENQGHLEHALPTLAEDIARRIRCSPAFACLLADARAVVAAETVCQPERKLSTINAIVNQDESAP